MKHDYGCAHQDEPHHARGMCKLCYNAWRRRVKHHQGLRTSGLRRWKQQPVRCSVVECERKARTLGLCSAHYTRHLRGVALDSPIGQRRRAGPKHDKRSNRE